MPEQYLPNCDPDSDWKEFTMTAKPKDKDVTVYICVSCTDLDEMLDFVSTIKGECTDIEYLKPEVFFENFRGLTSERTIRAVEKRDNINHQLILRATLFYVPTKENNRKKHWTDRVINLFF